MVVMFSELSQALDAFNANRVETEQIGFWEIVQDINDPLDEVEVMRLIIELYQEA